MTVYLGYRFPTLFKRIRKRKRSSSLTCKKSSSKGSKEKILRSKSAKSLISKKVALEIIGGTAYRKQLPSYNEEKPGVKNEQNLKKYEDAEEGASNLDLIYENENLTKNLEQLKIRLRDVERQLSYERVFYEEQKTQYVKEMRSRRTTRAVKTQTCPSDFSFEPEEITALVTELRNVRELYLKQKSLTARVCDKYVKLKEYKDQLIRRMVKEEAESRRIIQDLMRTFDEDRIAFSLLEKDFSLPQSVQGQMVRKLSKLSYNNAALQMEMKRLEFEKLKNRGNDLMSDYIIYSVLREMLDSNKDPDDEEARKKLYNVGRSYIALPIEYDEDGEKQYKLTPLFQVLNSNSFKDETFVDHTGYLSTKQTGEDTNLAVTEVSDMSSSILGSVKEVVARSESAPDIIQQAVR